MSFAPRRTVRASLFSLLVILACACTQPSQARPSRSDCIVGYWIDWTGVRADRADVINSLNISADLQRAVSLAGVAAPDTEHLYMQFSGRCSDRFELAAQVVRTWKQSVDPMPRFMRMDGVISPSPQTIDIRGPHWSD